MEVQPEPGTDSGGAAPTCYRHPGRPTYLTCVRCGRPACPDCLRPAPVGHQCVECVKDGSRGVRRPTAVFGGRAISGALVTWALIAVNVAVYIAEWAYAGTYRSLEMIGLEFTRSNQVVGGVADGEAYRLLTSAFVHYPGLGGFGPAHILFNMWALAVVGPALERLLGRVRFLAVYLLSALGGSVLFYLLAQPWVPALGASGAIFGLFAAWFVVARRLRLDSRAIVFLIVINLAITFTIPNIAWQAHVGGLVTGGVLTAAYAYAPRRNRALIQAAATVAVVAALAIAVVARDAQLAAAFALR